MHQLQVIPGLEERGRAVRVHDPHNHHLSSWAQSRSSGLTAKLGAGLAVTGCNELVTGCMVGSQGQHVQACAARTFFFRAEPAVA